jgi:hypothetical protein
MRNDLPRERRIQAVSGTRLEERQGVQFVVIVVNDQTSANFAMRFKPSQDLVASGAVRQVRCTR